MLLELIAFQPKGNWCATWLTQLLKAFDLITVEELMDAMLDVNSLSTQNFISRSRLVSQERN